MDRVAPTDVEPRFITETEAEALLGVLCVKFGFCLSPPWHARLLTCPPKSVAKFTDTVFRAEGLDPAAADKAMYKAIYEEVRRAFELSAQRASRAIAGGTLERSPP